MNEIFQGTAKDAGVTPPQKRETTAQQPTATVSNKPAATVQNEAARQRQLQDQTTNAVLEHITGLQSEGKLKLPANYSAGNELKMAWLTLIEVEDRNGNKALDVCTKESIANSLLKMTLMGLSVAKKQAAFVVYGKKLELQIEYHGTVALARRYGGIKETPKANVVYEDDDFIYTIDPDTGRKKIVKHDQTLKNMDPNKIVAAYAIVTEEDGSKNTEIMSMQQIRQAWMQGATKGQSPAHKNFPDQMAIKTVIGRACKLYITTSDDGGVYSDEESPQLPEHKPAPKKEREIMDVEYEEETPKQLQEQKNEKVDKKVVEQELPMENAPRKPNF